MRSNIARTWPSSKVPVRASMAGRGYSPCSCERNPTAPMPSFAGLPQEKKTAMVDFLSQLHGE